MTVVVKDHTNANYYITLELKQGRYGNYYEVQACPRFNECECGYPERSMVYALSEKKNAYAAFNRYKRKYI